MRVSRYIPPTFGRTHFIRGYHSTAQLFASKSTTVPPLSKQADDNDNQVCGAFFTPGDDLRSRLISFIDYEQERIQIAMYLFTDPAIATALYKAHKEGVKVELITDISCIHNRYNKVENLCGNISIFVYYPTSRNKNANRAAGLMHHKFLLFSKNKEDKAFVWIGSANLTKVALAQNNEKHNEEGVVVTSDDKIVQKFFRQFELIKRRCKKYRSPFDKPAE